jgi:hypothetical protein
VRAIVTRKYCDACEVANEIRMARLGGCVSWEAGIGYRSRVTFGDGCVGTGGCVWVIVSDVWEQENANGICGFRHHACSCFCCRLCRQGCLVMLTCRRCVCGLFEEVVSGSARHSRSCGGGALVEGWRNGCESGCRKASGACGWEDRLGMSGLGRSCQLLRATL